MNIEWVRRYCMSLPHTTEQIQWGHDLVFKIGGKMYAAGPVDGPWDCCLSFKAGDEFAELCEREGIIPAPYMARNQWVALTSWDALTVTELKRLVRGSYDMVFAKLPKKTQAELSGAGAKVVGKASRKRVQA
jgi:predicted DNA-binding protein (MmcQ/YjbR family)